jgi:membrane associated rhomboid family serine protease
MSSQEFPPVVKNLIIINVLVFLIQQVAPRYGINLDDYMALHYWASPMFRWWQLLTHMFMHGNLSHIFFNMYGLWMFGRILENIWGGQRFIIFYLICGLGAALCHMGVLTFEYSTFHSAFMHYQDNPTFPEFMHMMRKFNMPFNEHYMQMINEATVGASGAIFGLLFAFGYLFPNTELYIIFIPLPIKAKWLIGGYALIELSQGVYNSAGDNIAHFAHLGGMLFAFILLRIWHVKHRNDFY